MSRHLELILGDLRIGLRERAARRRRRTRAAGATLTSVAATGLAILATGSFLGERAQSASGDGTLTARYLAGDPCADALPCWLNLPKQPKE